MRTPHEKLADLWRELMTSPLELRADVILIDGRSMHELHKLAAPRYDGSLMFDVDGAKWRGIKLEIEDVPFLERVADMKIGDAVLEPPPIVSIRCFKPNGRITYLDDPENDERMKS